MASGWKTIARVQRAKKAPSQEHHSWGILSSVWFARVRVRACMRACVGKCVASLQRLRKARTEERECNTEERKFKSVVLFWRSSAPFLIDLRSYAKSA